MVSQVRGLSGVSKVKTNMAERVMANKPARGQQGFVLVLSLVLLTVLTLIGVTSMNSANMERRIAANTSQHVRLVNTVEAVLHYLSSGTTPVNYQTTVDQTYVDGKKSASILYAGCAKGIGSSLEEGRGFSYSYYQIRASAQLSKGKASATQVQGVRYPAAACN